MIISIKIFLTLRLKIAVLGLNPHCESINKFNEDEKILKPVVSSLSKKYRVSGPYSADTIFKKYKKKFNVILGMYHDQVLTPIKTIYDLIIKGSFWGFYKDSSRSWTKKKYTSF